MMQKPHPGVTASGGSSFKAAAAHVQQAASIAAASSKQMPVRRRRGTSSKYSSMSKLRPKSMHEAVFWRSRLTAAMRTAWACFMAGVIIQVGSSHVHWVTFPIFAYVMAVTVVGESTLGKAMQDTVAVITGTVHGVGMSLVLLQLLPPAKCFANIGTSIALVAVTSFLITYPSSSHILHKRVALVHSGIIYVTAAVQQQHMDPVFFPLRLAGTTIVGATCGMLALLLPLPHLALLQVYSQTKLSARITSERLKVLVDAFTTKDMTQASALNLQAKSLAKLGSAVHAEISSNEGGMGWEAWRFRLRTSENLQRVTQGLTSLRKTAVGLELALQADLDAFILARPGNMPKKLLLPARRLNYMMKQSLIYLTDWVSLALGHASTDIKHRSASSHTHRQIILEEGNEVLCNFDESLLTARQRLQEHLEYMSCDVSNILEEVLAHDDDEEDDEYSDSDGESSSHDNPDRLPAYQHHRSLGREGGVSFTYSDTSETMLDTVYDTAKKQLAYRIAAGEMGEDYHSDPVLAEVPTGGYHGNSRVPGASSFLEASDVDDNVYNNTRTGGGTGAGGILISPAKFEAQATAFFFLFNVKMFVQETKSILLSLDQDPRVANNSQHTFLHEHSTPNFQHLQMLAAINSSTQFMQYPSDLQLPAKNPQELSKLQIHAPNAPPYAHDSSYNSDLQKLCSKCESSMHASSFISRSKETNQSPALYNRLLHKLLERFAFKIEPTQLMAAFKMALAMAIGAFFGFWFNAKKGYWADITLALGYTGPAKGGSFRVAVLRSLGTVSGSIYGLLVVMATTHFPVMRLVALIPWVVFTSFLRQSKIFGYAGALSALTGAIVILARTNKDSSDQEFTVIRIVEAFLGMASFIIVEVLVFPRRAASMVKPEIVSGMSKMEQLVSSIFDAFSGEDCDVCGGYSVMDDLKAKEKKLRSLISRQNALVKEASEEPQFWFAAFPAKIFMKLMEQQGKIMEMLHFSMAALEELKQVGKETKIPMNRLLRDALNDAMRIMEEKVVPTFAFLEKVMSMKTTQQQYNERFSEQQQYQYQYQYEEGGAGGGKGSSRDIEAAGNLPELERLMRSELTARNSRAFKHCEFGDVAVQRGKRFMDAFERGVMYVANHLNFSLHQASAAAASPQHTPLNSVALQQFINNHQHQHQHHHHQIQQHSHSHSHSPVTTLTGIPPAAPSPISRNCSNNTNNNSGCCSSNSDPTSSGNGGVHSLTNSVLLSLGTLAFALNGLLHHTSELEKSVHELLQEENPWNLIDFWDTSKSSGHIWWGRRKSGRP